MPARVALATCRGFPALWDDDVPLRTGLERRGVEVAVPVWDDPEVDWGAFDLVVLRSTWDYSPRRDAFVAWAQSVPRLLNRADVVAWNTDKRYLRELAAAGVELGRDYPRPIVDHGEAREKTLARYRAVTKPTP